MRPHPSPAAAAPPAGAAIPVIYVVGNGRSGSTLLGQLLGAHSGVFNGGEVFNFRNFHLTADRVARTCACGAELRACPFWSEVRARLAAAGGDPLPDLKAAEPAAFVANNAALFRAALDVAGKRVMLDSTKRYDRLARLLASPAFDVTVVHLIRDARAYLAAVERTAERRGYSTLDVYRKVWTWNRNNAAIRLRLQRDPRYVLLRYEDLTAEPERHLRRVLDHAGLAFEPGQLDPHDAPFHDFSGNKRTRFGGPQPVRRDTRYLAGLSGRQWALGTALAWPAVQAFGYPLRRPAR
jgi:hypothetical protein